LKHECDIFSSLSRIAGKPANSWTGITLELNATYPESGNSLLFLRFSLTIVINLTNDTDVAIAYPIQETVGNPFVKRLGVGIFPENADVISSIRDGVWLPFMTTRSKVSAVE
jgi:hypothetical protein